MDNCFNTLVLDIKKQLEDRGALPGTRSGQSSGSEKNLKKVAQGDPKTGSRESRSAQQVINFSSPSFAGH